LSVSPTDATSLCPPVEAEAMCDHVWIGPPGPGPETEPEPVNPEPVEAEVGQPQLEAELSVAA
jgi:hypothetical protein